MATRLEREINAATWHEADRLLAAGTPPDEIAGGWSWFCRYHLHPGQVDNESYVTRFHRLQRSARYVVTDLQTPEEGAAGTEVRSTVVRSLGQHSMVRVFDRGVVKP
jgi:hypothetical protein